MIVRLTIKELAARKVRLLTTAFAVVLGVAFMAGTLIFTDTLGATYDNVMADAYAGTDAYVRGESPLDRGYGDAGPRLDATLLDTVRGVDGVAEAAVRVEGYAQLVGPDGQPVGDIENNPAFGLNWITVDELNAYQIVDGHAPGAADEIVIDKASADKAGYEPGDTATVLTQREPRQFTISGIARFGTADSAAGTGAVMFTDATAQELLASPGQVDAIAVTAAAGVSQDALAASIAAAVGDQAEVITGAQLTAEVQTAIAELLSQFMTFMMVFGFVAMFVGAFIINNTFSITVAQRSREMAMLRAIGAGGRQLLRAVLAEAVIIGAVASAAGLGVGVFAAAGLKALLGQFGIDVPDGSMVINPSSMIVAFAVGVTVTVVSAWLPARRAARIAPMAAMREVAVDQSAGSTRRTVAGLGLSAAGVGALVAGLGGGGAPLVGLGAAVVFVGVSVLGPVLARPVARVLGAPLRLRGVSGDLARRNAMRNPRRTARTASSLMIGVGLVGFITVFAASVKTSVAGSLEDDFHGTHIIESGAYDSSGGLSPELAEGLRTESGIDTVSEARVTQASVDGVAFESLFGFEPATIGTLFDLGEVTGDIGSLGTDGVAVSADHASDEGLTLGDKVTIDFPTGTATFVVRATYDHSSEWLGEVFVGVDAFESNVAEQLDSRVYVAGDEAVIERVAAQYPTADVLDKAGFSDRVNAEIDQILGLIYALLALAVLIALLGIANTLALSIFERTREIGVLRAIGMGRSQVRAAIRWESVIIAVFGTALGLAVGTFFGWAMVRAMAGDGIDTLVVPVGSLAVVVVVAAVAGVIAAVVPARRAARLDVLNAVSSI